MANTPPKPPRQRWAQCWAFVRFAGRWGLICLLVGALAGCASAVFLASLEWATRTREANLWLVGLLPLVGGLMGWGYHRWGQRVAAGTNLVLDEIEAPMRVIPFRMAPMVYLGTVLTHLFGGSAGREGTAVQMAAALADTLTRPLGLSATERRWLLVAGISAGFASVFGTPLAGTVFALEVARVGRVRYDSLLPALLAALVADWVCHTLGLWMDVHHTEYRIVDVPVVGPLSLGWILLAGVLFGLAARLFSGAQHWVGRQFARWVRYAPLRPVWGGAVLATVVGLVWWLGWTDITRYLGLGIPTIVESFDTRMLPYVFLLKLLLTAWTLGVGFKGGEVTPLFFVGAALGSTLAWVIPLPVGLLAGVGFVAVFAGATNTPLACTLMGIELFGADAAPFIALGCIVAYYTSGPTGIYTAQRTSSPKLPLLRTHGERTPEVPNQ